jgi:hypothetical protein
MAETEKHDVPALVSANVGLPRTIEWRGMSVSAST